VLVILCFVTLMIQFNKPKEKEVNLVSVSKKVEDEIEQQKLYQAQVVSVDAHAPEYLYSPSDKGHDEIIKDGDLKKYTMDLFLTGLMKQDSNIFAYSYEPGSLSKDLFEDKDTDKSKVLHNFMNHITRDNKLTKVTYFIPKGSLATEKDEIDLHLYYQDKKEAKMKLSLKVVTDEHNKMKYENYLITTSVIELGKTIEEQTKDN
jgi:hypothetical protein